MSTLIQCLLGPCEPQVGGQTYQFTNDEHRRAVCEVYNLVHIECFLSIQHYVRAEALPIPAAVIPSSAETLHGSNILPAVIQIDDDHTATLGEIVTARIERQRLEQERIEADEAIRIENERQANERLEAEQAAKDAEAARLAALAAQPDPLIDIAGIGEATVPKLTELEITTFAQIAAWDAATIADMDKKLRASGSITRNDWVGQAKALQEAKEAAIAAANQPKPE